ncbi:MAG TPA: DUF4258 domain-containing protein [Acidimicrobiales bacterium]|nr:DUF4258 domain-containing protein [Acidimicrobiales bacterium]
MDLTYADHALDRMALRAVTEQQVKDVLTRPIGQPDAGDPGKLSYVGYVSGGQKPMLKVVVSATDRTHIITTYWRDRP